LIVYENEESREIDPEYRKAVRKPFGKDSIVDYKSLPTAENN